MIIQFKELEISNKFSIFGNISTIEIFGIEKTITPVNEVPIYSCILDPSAVPSIELGLLFASHSLLL